MVSEPDERPRVAAEERDDGPEGACQVTEAIGDLIREERTPVEGASPWGE